MTARPVGATAAIVARRIGILPLLVLIGAIVIGLIEPRFFRTANLINVARSASFLALIASGQMLVLIVGGFDISVGAVVALSSVVGSLTMVAVGIHADLPVWLVIIAGISTGLISGMLVGAVNGFCVTYLKVPPFMVTLGTMSIASGIALYISAGASVYGLPVQFTQLFGRARFFNLPLIIYVAAIAVAIVWFVMNHTLFGRYIYAVGGDPTAARNSGVSANAVLVWAYVLCGLMAALTGLLLTARIGSGEATLGSTLMLESIAAAVIGGVSLRGGVGRVGMVVLGALVLSLVTNAMNLMRVDSKLQTIVVGAVIIIAVAGDAWRIRRRGKHHK